jgi:hypothetical protein
MKHLTDWINRLRQNEIQSRENPNAPSLAEYCFHIMVPGFKPLEIHKSLITVQPLGRVNPRPGDSGPTSVSVWRFPDTNDPHRPFEIHQQLVSEMAAILTLATERRIEIAREFALRVEGQNNTVLSGYGCTYDRRLHGPMNDNTNTLFIEWLSKVISLPEPHLSVIGAACSLHHGAVLLFEKDIRSAYLLLVAGIEVLSRQYGTPPTNWGDWEESRQWDNFMSKTNLISDQQVALRAKLMEDRNLKLQATFRNYGSCSLPDAFWDEDLKDWSYPIDSNSGYWHQPDVLSEKKIKDVFPKDRRLLAKCLGESYDLRSGLVHRGNNIELLDVVIPHDQILKEVKPLPFSILRSILTSLIKHEVTKYSVETSLPDIKGDFATP